MIGVTVLGSTGSIGVNTLDVAARHPDRYRIVALTANRDVARLAEQCRRHRPAYAVMADEQAAERLQRDLAGDMPEVQVLQGVPGMERVAALPETDYVMAAIVGAAGLLPTLAAARAGKRVLLANKEALVMAGRLFMDEIRRNGAHLLPIDSEHNAVFQCMPHGAAFDGALGDLGVKRIMLTASGGPFRTVPLQQLQTVTPDQACAHPNWVMGRKISVDSATMMNKGLEVIEASWLFNTSLDSIQVVIHPQSVVHSMVEYVDGSVLAQLGSPDMRTPIAHAMAWPQRIAAGVKPLDLFEVARLDFHEPDTARFPCLRLAYEAARMGGTGPALLNAANEAAVQAFLDGRLPFTGIAPAIERALEAVTVREAADLEVILEADRAARAVVAEAVAAPRQQHTA